MSPKLYDGFVNLERGVDSGNAPLVLGRNQVSWAVNATFRGGFATSRPGYRKVKLDFGGEFAAGFYDLIERFQGGTWQGAAAYQYDGGDTVLLCAIGGRVFTIRLNPPNTVTEIAVPADSNLPIANKVWMTQAEQWMLIQDGRGRPLIFDGETLRLSNAHTVAPAEVFIGTRMAYFMGRVWVSNGRDYTAGNLIWGPLDDAAGNTGTTAERSSVLQTTENEYLNEGGYFSVPTYGGEITALSCSANLDTSMGQGDLIVFTRQGVFATQVPYDRTTWKNLETPLQRVALPDYGAVSQESVVQVNTDLYFRADDGIRSLILARRDFSSWGNTPISREVARAMEHDDPVMLDWCSAAVFDNRLLCTVSPQRNARGVVWKGLVVLNFDTVSAMGAKSNPAWEGIWTGLNVLQLVKTRVLGIERCFAFAVNGAGQIELWELTKGDAFDNYAEPIKWSLETGSYNFGDGKQHKRLYGGSVWVNDLNGRVNFTVKFKPEDHPCWQTWHTWEDCAVTEDCDATSEVCRDLENFKPQYRPRIPLPMPPDECDEVTMRPLRDGCDFQFRIEIDGKARLKRFVPMARAESEAEFGEIPSGRCP